MIKILLYGWKHLYGSFLLLNDFWYCRMNQQKKTIFELGYDANNCFSSIITYDLNGNLARKIVLSYAGSGKYRLMKISRLSYNIETASWSDEYIEAQYQYNVTTMKMIRAYDVEKQMGINYQYGKSPTGYFVYIYKSFSATMMLGVQTVNAMVRAWPNQMRQTRYRAAGADMVFDTSDDIVTTYIFNSSGQTINAISTDDDNDDDDEDYTILGVTAAAYEENSGTSGTNNHISSSIASGQVGVNLLVNGGFEGNLNADNSANGWTHYLVNGSAACRGSTSGVNYSGDRHYNLYNSGTGQTASIYQEVSLVSGEEYTFSAYVNTSAAEDFGSGGGLYLDIFLPAICSIATSTLLSHKTTSALDNGWQRISLTFTANYTGTFLCYIYWKNAKGLVVVDDVQLEKGSAATRFNHVYNGSFESGLSGWSTDGNVTISTDPKQQGSKSVQMTVSTPEVTLYAAQEIKLNRSSNTTFLLSAWSKGNSMPGIATEIEETMDSTVRFWGLEVTLKYSDTSLSNDVFYLPFSDYATNWQYAAMAITPEKADETVASAVLKVFYHNNANEAYFDNISFIEEPAQTYKYDTEGNVISVQTGGNGKDSYEYDLEMEDRNLANILKNGELLYSYDYDTLGRLIHSTTVEDGEVVLYTDHQYDTSDRIKSQSWQIGEDGFSESYTYNTADGILTTMVTDGDTLNFSYDGLKRLAGRDSTNLKMSYSYRNLENTTSTTSQIGSIVYKKADGITTLLPTLGYTYDIVGNITKITSGTSNLAEYTYDTQNQLTAETVSDTYEYSYAYDTYGNIRGITRTNLTENKENMLSFTYDNSNWKDQLTGVSYTDEDAQQIILYIYTMEESLIDYVICIIKFVNQIILNY